MKPGRLGVVLLVCAALAGCGPSAVPRELTEAERAGDQGRWDDALKLYSGLVDRRCQGAPRDVSDWTLRKVCGPAALGRGMALARLMRINEAVAAFLVIPDMVGNRGRAASRALERAADLLMHSGQNQRAHELHYKVILGYPDSAAADDALRVLVREGRRHDQAHLLAILLELEPQVPGTTVGDNLLFEAALLTQDRGDLEGALKLYDRLALEYPKSGLRDDSWRTAAKILRGLGRPQEAIDHLEEFLRTKATARMIGSYNSPYLPDAAIEAGRIALEDMKAPGKALAYFRRAYDDYPNSTRRDDAAVWVATALAAGGEPRAACATLARHARRYPERVTSSDRAAALRAQLGCPPVTQASGSAQPAPKSR